MPQITSTDPVVACPPELKIALTAIVEALQGMRFGQLQVVVHEGMVVQIDRTERRRLERPTKSDVSSTPR